MSELLDDRFELLELLGAGRIGKVYRAQDRLEVREVALKIPHAWHSRNPEFAARFRRELLTGMRLSHPGIVRCLETGNLSGMPFLVMELIEGTSIDKWFASAERDYDRLGQVLEEALAALEYAHANRVVHQELKPANILVDRDGRPHILDFGLAGRLEDQVKLGPTQDNSLAYISPEQAMGERGDERSDLYSLGMVLFRILAERPVFQAEVPADYLLAHLNESPPPLSTLRGDIPIWLERLVGRLTARRPDQRPQSASDVQHWIQRHRSGPGPRRREPLWGREKERALLGGWLEGLAEGRGHIVRLSGEAGLGKSRLAEDVLEQAREEGYRTVTVEATEGAVLHLGMISRRFGSPGVPLVEQLVESALEQPLVLHLEGVHRAHESVADLLGELVTVVDEVPLLALVTDRPEAIESDAIRDVLAALPHQLELGGLDDQACAHLIEERTWSTPPRAAVAWFLKVTNGNPLFVRLLAEHLEGTHLNSGTWSAPPPGTFPDTLRELLKRKLDRQGSEALAVLGVAACLGERFEFNLLKAVTYLDERALEGMLEQLGREGLLREEWASGLVLYRFAYVGLWSLALERIPRRRQRRIHLLAARFLEKSHQSAPAKLARHYTLADQVPEALYHRALAFEQAEDRGEATYHYVQLLELARKVREWPGPALASYRSDVLPRPRRRRALIAWALVSAGRPAEALERVERDQLPEAGALLTACFLEGAELDAEEVETTALASYEAANGAEATRLAGWIARLYRKLGRLDDAAGWSSEPAREPSRA